MVSNAEVKVISNSIFQNSVFWKTGLSDTYKWIISNIQRLKNAKSDSATKMWSNYLYLYVATYLVHSIVVKVALNNMLTTTAKRPNIPISDMSPTEKYLQAEGETYLDKWASD